MPVFKAAQIYTKPLELERIIETDGENPAGTFKKSKIKQDAGVRPVLCG